MSTVRGAPKEENMLIVAIMALVPIWMFIVLPVAAIALKEAQSKYGALPPGHSFSCERGRNVGTLYQRTYTVEEDLPPLQTPEPDPEPVKTRQQEEDENMLDADRWIADHADLLTEITKPADSVELFRNQDRKYRIKNDLLEGISTDVRQCIIYRLLEIYCAEVTRAAMDRQTEEIILELY